MAISYRKYSVILYLYMPNHTAVTLLQFLNVLLQKQALKYDCLGWIAIFFLLKMLVFGVSYIVWYRNLVPTFRRPLAAQHYVLLYQNQVKAEPSRLLPRLSHRLSHLHFSIPIHVLQDPSSPSLHFWLVLSFRQ